jgi:coenzyme F420 biosynthesis associated uncharacterized protein
MSSIDWDTAISVAGRFSGSHPLADTYHERRYALEAAQHVARASEMVQEETGLSLPGAPVVGVIGRDQWVETNVRAFTALLEPLSRTQGRSGGSPFGGKLMGAELGAVLGFLSKRVLGQYELVLPTGDDEVGDTVYFVGANVLDMERRQQFRPSHFRFWVALHESAHRAQFTGVPWMREYFLSLVDELVSTAPGDRMRLPRLAAKIAEARDSGEDPFDDTGLLGALASPQQRAVIDKVQALMSLLEGHGHVVMDRIGARELADLDRMSRVLTARRQNVKNAALMRLIGMEMKLKQYEMGAAFIHRVEVEASWDALSMAWESPDALPTLAEIEDPPKWLARMAS